MRKAQSIRLLVADDHICIREGLTLLLERQPEFSIVAQASNALEAVELYRHYLPDVTLMDLSMPEMDGVEAIETIRAEFPHAAILILSTYDGDEDIYRGLHAG